MQTKIKNFITNLSSNKFDLEGAELAKLYENAFVNQEKVILTEEESEELYSGILKLQEKLDFLLENTLLEGTEETLLEKKKPKEDVKDEECEKTPKGKSDISEEDLDMVEESEEFNFDDFSFDFEDELED
jgi:hypothetical protein